MAAPTSTYRLQLHAGFTFSDAAAVVPYLARLGVSHVYCSPILQAAAGSTHGYDVTDHTRLSADLGGRTGWQALVAACRAHGLGIVVDVVPNHMAADPTSAPWWDVLRHGRASRYADWFDVDWDAKLLVPVLGRPLAECLADGEIRFVDGEVRYYEHRFPVTPDTESLADDVGALLDAQHYRLAFWRVGGEELNYRRFFDVTTLAALRVEEPAVFDATHALLLGLVRDGEVDGLRIDHPDGLADPRGYLRRLAQATEGRWVVVEKILEPGEELPDDWPCAGTTGYDALNRLTHVLTDPAGGQPLSRLYFRLTGETADFATVADDAKAYVVRNVLAAEVEALVRLLRRAAATDRRLRDVPDRWWRDALRPLLAAFPVYRAYVVPGEDPPATSVREVATAVDRACRTCPERAGEIRLLGELALRGPVPFVVRFQQTTGPVLAKGVEDTAFYRYFRLVAHNEVGGDPGRFGLSLADFHAACAAAQAQWPLGMTTLSTHDTKRSEDVRARLLVLAELPEQWASAVDAWRSQRSFPADPNLEYLFWQTLAGAWPLELDRMLRHLEKAAREGKRATSWTDPHSAFEESLAGFARSVYDDAALLADVDRFVTEVLDTPARSNSLAMKLVQLTMPGVPDVYQGCELEDRSLVDPDNRRPVDFAIRSKLLADPTADPKLLVTTRALQLRREHPDWFTESYMPLDAGPHLLGFLRGDRVAVLATRLPVGLARDGWGDAAVTLPDGPWVDVLTDREHTGGRLALTGLLDELPVALLIRR